MIFSYFVFTRMPGHSLPRTHTHTHTHTHTAVCVSCWFHLPPIWSPPCRSWMVPLVRCLDHHALPSLSQLSHLLHKLHFPHLKIYLQDHVSGHTFLVPFTLLMRCFCYTIPFFLASSCPCAYTIPERLFKRFKKKFKGFVKKCCVRFKRRSRELDSEVSMLLPYHTHTHTHMHARTHTHTHARTHTHAHIHAQPDGPSDGDIQAANERTSLISHQDGLRSRPSLISSVDKGHNSATARQ